MATTETPVVPEQKMVQVPQEDLTKVFEKLAEFERNAENDRAKIAGLEILAEKGSDASPEDTIKKRKNYEPAFRTVRIRKYPIAGDFNNLGYVVGWTDRGAYQKVDTSGVSKVLVDYIDIVFLGKERNAEGKLQAESVPLLDLLNKGVQVHCKIVSKKVEYVEVPTGEEIDITTWDPQHGLVATGDKVDGYYAYSDIKYTIDIPGVGPYEIDGEFVN